MGYNADRVSIIKDRLKNLVPTYFGATLGRETDIVNIVCALIYYESRFNVNAVGVSNSTARGSAGYKYLSSSAISTLLASSPY